MRRQRVWVVFYVAGGIAILAIGLGLFASAWSGDDLLSAIQRGVGAVLLFAGTLNLANAAWGFAHRWIRGITVAANVTLTALNLWGWPVSRSDLGVLFLLAGATVLSFNRRVFHRGAPLHVRKP